MSVVTVERLHALAGTRVGTNKAEGPYWTPDEQKLEPFMPAVGGEETAADPRVPPGINRVRTGPGNRPHQLFAAQWETDNDLLYDRSITNATAVIGNAGGAALNFHDFNNVNSSLDGFCNAYRSNANGLPFQFDQTNPKTHPYIVHRQINPNGFTNPYNPVEPTPVRVDNSTSMKWSDALFQAW
jgi:hypothetical protein